MDMSPEQVIRSIERGKVIAADLIRNGPPPTYRSAIRHARDVGGFLAAVKAAQAIHGLSERDAAAMVRTIPSVDKTIAVGTHN